MSELITITKEGYAPVQCEPLLPCPFCGSEAELSQLAHVLRYEQIGRSRKSKLVKYAVMASSSTLVADEFKVKCPKCHCSTDFFVGTALEASKKWNTRYKEPT